MSAWQDVDLAGVSAEMERIPEGQYVFGVLQGAKYNQWDPNKVEVPVRITEGEFAGRVMYVQYPDPEKMDWSPAALKRLTNALVKDGAEEVVSGIDPVTYLNLESVVGKQFLAPIKHREFKNKDGEPSIKEDLQLFKVKPLPTVA